MLRPRGSGRFSKCSKRAAVKRPSRSWWPRGRAPRRSNRSRKRERSRSKSASAATPWILSSLAGTIHQVGELHYSDQQREAIERVRGSLDAFAPFLLQGITGSGKTEVYIELMREVVRRGRQAILLVPEIALTPVFASRLMETVWRADRDPPQRIERERKVRSVVAGAKSGRSMSRSVRARRSSPLSSAWGFIVVDEEGDSRLQAGGIAPIQRPRPRGAALQHHRYSDGPRLGNPFARVSRERRARTVRDDPAWSVASRSEPAPTGRSGRYQEGEGREGGPRPGDLQRAASRRARRVFAAGEQAIILINRRGYAPFLLCRECENDFRCRDCSVTLTVHRAIGQLICHYCGSQAPDPGEVPALQRRGSAADRIRDGKGRGAIRPLFSRRSGEVLDRDSIRRRGGSWSGSWDRFRAGDTRALIGTQMISKGHHFPRVTLTAVINADCDSRLSRLPFRGERRSISSLRSQAAPAAASCRARSSFQTGYPDHYAIQHAIRHDYETFLSRRDRVPSESFTIPRPRR
jgi:primosomal protein N' (replication factor Y) (superfamily II helicase)